MILSDTYKHRGLRKMLVDNLRRKGIKDEKVLSAINEVPRHLFIESGFINYAYKNQAFPIGSGQTISQPYTVAYQTSLLNVKPKEKILEIGTGSGYQTAVLIKMGAIVYTIERQHDLFVKTNQLLPELGFFPHSFFGDGYKGLPTYGPFDKILVTAGAPTLPKELLKQLRIGGRMVIPLGSDEGQTMFVYTRTGEDKYQEETHGKFVFVPMLKGIENNNNENT